VLASLTDPNHGRLIAQAPRNSAALNEPFPTYADAAAGQ
jgi:hypothetical protein